MSPLSFEPRTSWIHICGILPRNTPQLVDCVVGNEKWTSISTGSVCLWIQLEADNLHQNAMFSYCNTDVCWV